MPFETVLFDVDGTLVDSNGAHAEAWTASLREHGLAADVAQIRVLIGMGADKLIPAAAHVDESSPLGQSIAARKKEIFGMWLPSLQPTRGARSLVERLRTQGVTVAVATSADDADVRALLQRAGVDDLVPHLSSKNDAPESKPDPDIVHAALIRSGARPQTSVLIGDTPYDIAAATRAGIRAIALRCGGYWSDRDLAGAVEIFDDPQSLAEQWPAGVAR